MSSIHKLAIETRVAIYRELFVAQNLRREHTMKSKQVRNRIAVYKEHTDDGAI